MKPRLWNVTIRFVDETSEPVEQVVLAEYPSRALGEVLAGLRIDEVGVMMVQENSTSIDVLAWESSK